MSSNIQNVQCHYLLFGIIVTGKGENNHIPALFRTLMESGVCRFEVIQFAGQRAPITSAKRELKMVGSGKTIPNRDVEEIGLPARRYLSTSRCHFVILIDDLEHDRSNIADRVFERYRRIFDTLLDEEQRKRVAVHFLANMLEAYYLAHADALNIALDLADLFTDHEGDVETIVHPKGDIKTVCRQAGYSFDEKRDAGPILELLDIDHVLSNPSTCAYLRTLFAWCVKVLETRYPYFDTLGVVDKFCLANGVLSAVTRAQIDALST